MPGFKWANTALGNIKAITGTYRAIDGKNERATSPNSSTASTDDTISRL
jgi:hypothetical protein